MICMRLRASRMAGRIERVEIRAVEDRLALASALIRRSSVRPSVVLPDPLSPTRPVIEPRRNVEADIADRVHGAARRDEAFRQVADLEQRLRHAVTSRPAWIAGDPVVGGEIASSATGLLHSRVGAHGSAARRHSPAAWRGAAERCREWARCRSLSPRSGRRDGMQQALGIGMARAGEQLPDAGLLDDRPGIHHRHVVGHFRDHAHVVGDEQDRHAELSLQPAHQVEDLRLDGDVERGRRLVGDQQCRIADQRQGDHRPLAHAAGQLVRIVVDARRCAPGSRPAPASRARACGAPRRRGSLCSSSISPIWSPMVNSGLSDDIGSWKIIAISAPRSARMAASVSAGQVDQSRPRRSGSGSRRRPPRRFSAAGP